MHKKGVWYGVLAYLLWGFFPAYWKQLEGVPAIQLLGHRVVWSFLLLMAVVLWTRRRGELGAELTARTVRIYLLAAVLIAVNWLTYVWAVNAGFIVETSLGYFINPLLSMLLGVFILRERLRAAQWIPIVVAAVGVTYLTRAYGRLPWIALTLALSFALYGLVKKVAPLGALFGLTLETGLLFLPAVLYLGAAEAARSGAFVHAGPRATAFLAGAGIVTTIPLVMFASAARRIPLVLLGILQYIAPSVQFLLGVFVYQEPFDSARLVGFTIVWLALVLFGVENYLAGRTPTVPVAEMGEG